MPWKPATITIFFLSISFQVSKSIGVIQKSGIGSSVKYELYPEAEESILKRNLVYLFKSIFKTSHSLL